MLFFGANDSEPTVSPEGFRDNLIWMIHFLKMEGVRKFSIVAPTARCEGGVLLEYGESCPPYARMAREAADRSDAVLVPLDMVFAFEHRKNAGSPMTLHLTRDGVHLSERGSILAAEIMLSAWKMEM